MRSRLVSTFSEALAKAKIPVLDVASRYSEVGGALLPVLNPILSAKYGLELSSFILENVSVPPEVEEAIDKRSGMGAVGNLNDYVKYQMGQGMAKGEGGVAGVAASVGLGMNIAREMMQQQPGSGAAPAGATGLPELLSAADAAKALGVSEADVLATLQSGELKGKKIGSTWRITRDALNTYLNS